MATTTRGGLGRRRFLAAGGAVAALLVADRLAGAWPVPVQRGGYPFTLGVASGDPAPGGVVLWTRLAPQRLQPDGGMPARAVPVDWQVAADPGLGRIVRAGTVLAQPAQAHAVHVEVGGLEPARTYWYRFRAGGELSPVGRTRTLPAPGSSPGRLALAVVSCQHFEHGYYSAYQHLAHEDLDLVLHLGDYLYETAPADGQPRRHTTPAPTDLAGYRLRHALYRTDPNLQAAHAALPFVLTWDDHEVENDYADDQSERFDQPCDGNGVARGQVVVGCAERLDPRRSLLGAEQSRWLLAGLDRSRVRWNVIAQQLLMAELELQPGPGLAYGSDGWDGYAADRARILEFFQARRPSNPVVLGGDMHSFWGHN